MGKLSDFLAMMQDLFPSSGDVNGMLARGAAVIGRLLSGEAAIIFKWEPQLGQLVACGAWQWPGSPDRLAHSAAGQLLFNAGGQVITSDQAPLGLPDPGESRGRDLRFLIKPLTVGGKPWGYVVAGVRDRNLDADSAELLSGFAHYLGVALESSQLYATISQKIQEFSELMTVQHALNVAGDLEGIFSEVIRKVQELVDAEIGGIMLFNPATNRLEMQKPAFGMLEEHVRLYQVNIERGGNAARVFLTGQPAIINDAPGDPVVLQEFVQLCQLRNILTVPLDVSGKRLGVLHVSNKRAGDFTEADCRSLQALSHLLATLLENARLLGNIRKHEIQSEALHRTGMELAGLLDESEVAVTIARRSCQMVAAAKAAVYRPAAEAPGIWRLAAVAGDDIQAEGAWPPSLDEPGKWLESCRDGDSLAIPMRSGAELEGIVIVKQGAREPFSARDEDLLLRLSPYGAIALKNARLYLGEKSGRTALAQLNYRLAGKNQLLERISSFQRLMTEAMLLGSGLEGITRSLCEFLESRLTFYDRFFHPVVRQKPGGVAPADPQPLSEADREQIRKYLAKPEGLTGIVPLNHPDTGFEGGVCGVIRVQKQILGYVVVETTVPIDEMVDLALQQGVQAIALELLRQRSAYEAEQRVRGAFLEELLKGGDGNERSLMQRAALLGHDLTRPYRAVVIEIISAKKKRLDGYEDEARSTVERVVQSGLRDSFPGSMVAVNAARVIVLLALATVDSDQGRNCSLDWGKQLAKVFSEQGVSVVVGIGNLCRHPTDYPRSFAEARRVVATLKRVSRVPPVATYDMLGAISLLLSHEDGEMRSFARRLLGDLIAYDEKNSSDLLATLRAFLAHECQTASTARALSVHLNTLRYRLSRIREISGFDLHDPETRFSLRMALKIMDLEVEQAPTLKDTSAMRLV